MVILWSTVYVTHWHLDIFLMKRGPHPTQDNTRHSDQFSSQHASISMKIFFSWNKSIPSACFFYSCKIQVSLPRTLFKKLIIWFDKIWSLKKGLASHRLQHLLLHHPPRVKSLLFSCAGVVPHNVKNFQDIWAIRWT